MLKTMEDRMSTNMTQLTKQIYHLFADVRDLRWHVKNPETNEQQKDIPLPAGV